MKHQSFLHCEECHQSIDGIPDTNNETVRAPISSDGTPISNLKYLVPAGQGRATLLAEGRTISVTNTFGTQVCDLWAFNVNDLCEYFSIEHTRGEILRINPKVGDVLLTNHRRPILRFVGDTSPGVHDTLIAACDVNRYKNLGIHGYHDNCADNLRQALLAIGLRTSEVPQPLNLWMNIPSADDSLRFCPTSSSAGDSVAFTAMMDCVIVMSACPMDLNDINGGTLADVHFTVF